MAAEDWRVGVQSKYGQDRRFRYGIISAYDDSTRLYQVRYDDGKGHEDIDPAQCRLDWVQPDAHRLALAARKGMLLAVFQQKQGCYHLLCLRHPCKLASLDLAWPPDVSRY